MLLAFFVFILVGSYAAHAALEMPGAEKIQPLQTDGIYRFTKFKEVTPLNFVLGGKIMQPDGDDITYVFHRGEPVRLQVLKNGILRLTRGMSLEDLGKNPSEIEVSVEQFQASDLEMVTSGVDLQNLYISFTSQQDQYVSRGRRVKRRGGGSCSIDNWGTGECVKYIKRTEGITGTLGNGGQVAANLAKHHGYRPIPCSNNPQPGTIASWPGHVAKWDGSCWRTLPAIACSCNNGDPGRGDPLLCVIK